MRGQRVQSENNGALLTLRDLRLPTRDARPVSVVLASDPAYPDARIAGAMVEGMVQRFQQAVMESAYAEMATHMPVKLPPRPEQYVQIEHRTVAAERRSVFDWVVPGMLVFALIGIQTGIAVELTRDIANGLLDRLRVTRMGSMDYILGRLLPWIVMAAIQTVFLVGVAYLFGFRLHGSLALVVFLGMATIVATYASAYLISSFSRNERQASSISTFVGLGVSFYVGSFFPVGSGSPLFHIMGHAVRVRDLLPWSHMVTALRSVMLDQAGFRQIGWDLGVFAATTALLFAIAMGVFSRRRLRRE
jgi:ABC-2 type transport system permease protein